MGCGRDFISNMEHSFTGIQNLYMSTYCQVQPKVLVNDFEKYLLGKLDVKTGNIIFERIRQIPTIDDEVTLIVRPTFATIERSFSTTDCDNDYRYIHSDRERSTIYVNDRLPILEIALLYKIQDPILIKQVENAKNLANQFFFESNLSISDKFLGFMNSFGIST